MMDPIRVEAAVKTQPAYLAMPCRVEVTLTNQSAGPVVIVARLAVGYKDSTDRELYAEVFQRGTAQMVSKQARLYQRNPPGPQAYVSLEPGKSVFTTFDLFKWYKLPGPGSYDLVVSYKVDESLPNQPKDFVTGTYSSERVPFDVT
jgi:hypothetical protein